MTTVRVARPDVLRAVPLERHTLIEASAGTGKTFALEHLVVELLLSTDATLDQILVVTFTEKATNELRARVRAKLVELVAGRAAPPDDAQIRSGDFWTLGDAERLKLARALRTFDAATIATIHAFCQRVLHENAFAGGRLFEERPIDGRAAFGRALRDALRRDVAGDPRRAPWLETALRAGWSLAAIEDLLWSCAQAKGRLRPALDPAALDAALASFPSEDAHRPGIGEDMKRAGAHPQTALKLARLLHQLGELVQRAMSAGGGPAFVLQAKSIDFGWLEQKLAPLAPLPGPAARLREAALALIGATPPFASGLAQGLLPAVTAELIRTKRTAGRYDFDDMLTLVDEGLRAPRGRALAQALRRRWRYALVDEFQDTDETQWSVFRRAFFEHHAGSPASVLFLVGDPKQSIYRFRGADVQTYLRARDEVLSTGGARVSLARNYRATRPLVDATNALFDPDALEPFFTGDVEYTRVECGRPDRALVDGAGRPVSPVHVFRFRGSSTLSALGVRIAREILVLTDRARPYLLQGEALQFSDIFVLTRTSREGRAIGAALLAAGVPHAFYKEEGLFQTAEANDLRVLLAAICDPRDRACRLAAWLTPFFGLPLDAIERARDLPAAHPLVERLDEWKVLADKREFERLFENIATESGVLRREIFFSDGERRLTNYLHVLEYLLARSRSSHLTLRELLQELAGLIAQTRLPIDIEGNVQRLESDRRAVQIMTIHKAKGLEAPVVFVAGGHSPGRSDDVRIFHEQGLRFAWVGRPLSSEVDRRVKLEEQEEDQRLMYVALTRAIGRLYLPCVVDEPKGAKAAGPSDRPKALRGPYASINRRLVELTRAGETEGVLLVEDVAADVAAAAPAPRLVEPWRPPMDLLRVEDAGAAHAALRSAHAGPVVTSYTRLHGERGGAAWIDAIDERRVEKADEGVDEAPRTTLRAARASGVFLHETLERVPLRSFEPSLSFDEWRARDDVAALFDETIAIHRIEREQRLHAERLVWTAYTTTLALPGAERIDRLAAAARTVREMVFVYPIPEPHHPTLEDIRPRTALSVRQGYVRGSIDLAFEHRGLTYFVDWKSDSLASYEPETLGRHVAAHYLEQVQLYALAVVRLLAVHTPAAFSSRFGGILYCFLRGMDGEDRGVWCARPDWQDIVRWDDALRARRQWGGKG